MDYINFGFRLNSIKYVTSLFFSEGVLLRSFAFLGMMLRYLGLREEGKREKDIWIESQLWIYAFVYRDPILRVYISSKSFSLLPPPLQAR